MNTNWPSERLRRGPLDLRHQAAGCEFVERASGAVVMNYSADNSDRRVARNLGLVDLSSLPRTGFKGVGAPTWISSLDGSTPAQPNEVVRNTDGTLIARLSNEEFLVLENLPQDSGRIGQLVEQSSAAAESDTFILPRADSHCWFAMTGEHAPECLAKVCAVDCRQHKFSNGDVAQTSLSYVNAIIIRSDLLNDQNPLLCFFILCDISLAEFLWDGLLDSMSEFDGQPVGLGALI